MNPDIQDILDIANQMLWITFLLSMPILLTSLIVGVGISVVQTLTGVQEMTITFVPKLIAVLTAIAFALPWMSTLMMEYTEALWSMMGIPYS